MWHLDHVLRLGQHVRTPQGTGTIVEIFDPGDPSHVEYIVLCVCPCSGFPWRGTWTAVDLSPA